MVNMDGLSELKPAERHDAVLNIANAQDLEPLLQQAATLQQAGHAAEAMRLYRDILQHYPTHAVANRHLAIILLQANEVEASLPLFKTALEAAPEDARNWISYLDALLQAGHYDDATLVMEYGVASGLQGDEVDALNRRLLDACPATENEQPVPTQNAEQMTSSEKSAILHTGKSKQSEPALAEINTLVTLFNEGQLEKSHALAMQMTQCFPGYGIGWKVLGAIYQQQGQVDQAFQALKTAAELMPKDAEAQYNLGNCFYDQQRLDEAAKCYKKAIKLVPSFAQAHYNLGNVFKTQEHLEQAEASYRKALAIESGNASIHVNLAQVLYERGRFSDAKKCYEQALKIQPDLTAAHVGLGAACKALGQLQEAEASFNQAISISDDVDAYNNLGDLLKERGRFSEAEEKYKAAISAKPTSADAYVKLGILLRNTGRVGESVSYFNDALAIEPLRKDIHNDLGLARAEQGMFAEAEACYQKALEIDPDYWVTYNNLGLTLHTIGRLAEAESAFNKAIELNPNQALIYSNLSLPLAAQGHIKKAEASLKKAVELSPEYVNAHINLCTNYLAQGLAQEAEDACFDALKLQPDSTKARSNLLFTMNYSGHHSADDRLAQACEFDRIVTGIATPFTSWKGDPGARRLRVGLVSGDLRQHPVAYFLENWARNVDFSKLELIAYLTDNREDAVTGRLKPNFAGWKSLVGISDQAAAELIHDDAIDILLDLSGHTSGNRLQIFAWKPAPVQASWIGYFATTGMKSMDYFIADEVGVPEGDQTQFVEKIKYVPDTRLCFTAPNATVEVSPLPALTNGYITLASFQTMVKAGDDVLALWAEVMHALPSARLRWQCKSFGDPAIAADLIARLEGLGVDSGRVTLLGSVSRDAYLAAHAEVDVILDTFPYPGGTTTCEALWMGVPTLTLAGDTLIARQGASMLTAAGLGSWVAENKADYVSKAISLCGDLNQLAELRISLRQQVLASPLFDAPRFARNIETALREMWTEYKKDIPLEAQSQFENAKSAIDNIKIEIISATKYSEADFWEKSALGLSLPRHLKQNSRLSVKVAFENRRGLSEIFNQCIERADVDAVLVFIHDDVWIDEADFADAVITGLEQFDVIGIAGNKRRVPNQPAWSFIDLKLTWDEPANLSGRIAYGENAFGIDMEFGEVPAECELLDGVFFAVKKSNLDAKRVRFDTQFDFHFYDMDFCRTARQAGLKLGTWPLKLTHQSGGAFGTLHWTEKCRHYFNKWESEKANHLALQDAISEVFNDALEHQQAGRVEQAALLYQEILKIQPNHADANHNLGLLEVGLKGVLEALPLFEKAVQAQPEQEQFWVSYIDALMQSGATDTVADALELGQKYGLRTQTAQTLAAEYVKKLESSIKTAHKNQLLEDDGFNSNHSKEDKVAKYVIVAPYYTAKSAGIVVLHELCDSLNKLGHKAALVLMGTGKDIIPHDPNFYGPNLQWHPLKDNDELNEFINDGIVIYPEIVTGNPLCGKRVVRYLLNSEGAVAQNRMQHSQEDFILSFSRLYHQSPHAYLMKLPFNPLFNSDDTVDTPERTLDLTYIGKGVNHNQCFVIRDTLEINRQWPSDKAQLALLLRNTRYFYSWDVISQTNADALFCGAIPVFMSPLPLKSYDDLSISELGAFPMATASLQGDEVAVHLPDDYDSIMINFKKNYMEIVKNYNERLLAVVEQINRHFLI